jgi:hypothetical protein
LGLNYADLRRMILNAAGAAFLSADGRRRLKAHFESLLAVPSSDNGANAGPSLQSKKTPTPSKPA